MTTLKYNSTEIAKHLDVKHANVRKKIEYIIKSIKKIEASDNPIQYLCGDFAYKKEKLEYRGNFYDSYNINKAFLMLLLGRLKGNKPFDMNVTLIAGLTGLENKIEEKLKGLSIDRKMFLFNSSLEMINEFPEDEYKKRIMDNWDNIFPEYKFVGKEVKTPDGEFIDIVAEDSDGKTIIIEVKPYTTSAHKQLRSYSFHYPEAILVNLTPAIPKNQVDGIRYVKF